MLKETMSNKYRNPPKKTKSRKGRAANPKGGPRQSERPLSVGYLFRKVAREQVPIEVDGTKMPCWHAYVRQIYTMALNKDHGAARLLARIRKQFPGDMLPGDPTYFLITEEDARL
jgi:hypothetical protein